MEMAVVAIITGLALIEYLTFSLRVGLARGKYGVEAPAKSGREPVCEPTCKYVLGINNRDLSVQRTDLAVTERLASMLPADTPFVTESGLATREDVIRVMRAGARAMLVGESLLKLDDISGQIEMLLGTRDPH